jgi:hypothetical protein
MKFISKISRQGEDLFIRIPREKRKEVESLRKHKENLLVDIMVVGT